MIGVCCQPDPEGWYALLRCCAYAAANEQHTDWPQCCACPALLLCRPGDGLPDSQHQAVRRMSAHHCNVTLSALQTTYILLGHPEADTWPRQRLAGGGSAPAASELQAQAKLQFLER